jgi:hypothetical protein
MKKILVFFVLIVSFLLLSVIVGAYFVDDIFNLVTLSRTMNTSIIPESEIQILLFLSIVGLVAIMRKRPNNK